MRRGSSARAARTLAVTLAACVVAGLAIGAPACSGDTFSGTPPASDAAPDAVSTSDDGSASTDAAPCDPNAPARADDPRNCGSCGHDCLGGACVASACQPTTVADGLDRPAGVATDGVDVFIGMNGTASLVSCPVEGCGARAPATVDSNIEVWDVRLLPGATLLYTASGFGNGVYEHATTPGSGQLAITQSAPGGVEAAVATSDGFTYAAYGGTASGTASLLHVASAGGTASTLVTESGRITGLTATADRVFFANRPAGTVQECPIPCSAANVAPYVTFADSWAFGVVVSGETVYMTEESRGRLVSCPVDPTACNGAPTQLLSGLSGPSAITTDGTSLYWADSYSGSIRGCAIADCATTLRTLASGGVGAIWFIANDATSVVWSELAGTDDAGVPRGRVRRVAK